MSADAELRALAEAYGVHPGFFDLQGRRKDAPPPTLRALLRAMGVDASSDAAVTEALAARRAQDAARVLPAEIVTLAGQAVKLPAGQAVAWSLTDETGGERAAGRAAGTLELPPLEPGYYDLHVSAAGGRYDSFVICRPAHAPRVEDRAGPSRSWGFCGALYGMRSARNGGLGSYADLPEALRALAQTGAQFLGLNPVHALGWASEETISPYSPTHRGFFGTDHIGPSGGLGPTPAAELIDYAAFRAKHRPALEADFRAFQASGDRAAFEAYRKAAGAGFDDFAVFEALSETHGEDSRSWPAALQTPGAAARKQAGTRAAFHAWLQWRAERQIDSAQQAARAAGMDFGLYLDLAVGARPGGAEVWMNADTIAEGVTIGAPPDFLNPEGQSWNLAAHAPAKLSAARYAPFRAMLRKLMARAGIVRIDHALGLLRSFWQPDDGSPGGYVSQPFDSFLAIIAIEAERAGCVVVGEDLGLVPEGFREKLNGAGLYSYAVWQYETWDNGTLRPPQSLRPFALACFGTHDTPTIRGFWYGQDIAWWRRMGWLSDREAQARHDMRSHQRHALRGLCHLSPRARPDRVTEAIQQGLTQAPSRLVALQLDDAFGCVEAQNLPGTIHEHPNWRRRLPVAVSDLHLAPPLAGGADSQATTA